MANGSLFGSNHDRIPILKLGVGVVPRFRVLGVYANTESSWPLSPTLEARQAVNTVDSLGALFRAHLRDANGGKVLTKAAWNGTLELAHV